MKLFPNGDKIFKSISRYDDMLTLENRPGYEPGDTLALIAPFLVYHKIKETDIVALAKQAALVKGATQLISLLKEHAWHIFCISTSYEQYALHIAQRLGISSQNVACTAFSLDEIVETLCKDEFPCLQKIEGDLLNIQTAGDDEIKQILDRFYWNILSGTSMKIIFEQVKPMGGQRKVEASKRFAQEHKELLSNCVVIGDSITDSKMLQTIDQASGLAIAFNANEYALPYATMGLASTRLDDLWPVLETWEKGRRQAVQKLIDKGKIGKKTNENGYLHWLSDTKNVAEYLPLHRRFRSIVRKDAARLG
jgi:energy-converting hydrogenase A subunit R